jgi:hypothetical protein
MKSIASLALTALLSSAIAKPDADKVKDRKLPKFDDPLPSDLYSGYLEVT